MDLTQDQSTAVERFIDAVHNYRGGNISWQRDVVRYTPDALPVEPDDAHLAILSGQQ